MKKLQLLIFCVLLGTLLFQCDKLEVRESKAVLLSQDKDFEEYNKATNQAYVIIENQISKLSASELTYLDSLLLNRKNVDLANFEIALGLNNQELSNISFKQRLYLKGFVQKFDIVNNSSSTKTVQDAFVFFDRTASARVEDPCKVADNNCRKDGAVKAAISMAGCALTGPGAGVCAAFVTANALYDLYVCARNYQDCVGNKD